MTDFEDSSLGHTEVHTPTIVGATIDTVTSKYGGGSGYFHYGWVTYPDSADWILTTTFTVSIWFHGGIGYLSYRDTSGTWWSIRILPAQIAFYTNVGENKIIRGDFPTLDAEWHHLEIGRSGNNGYIFLDGVSITVSESGTGSASGNPMGIFYVGYRGGSTSVYCNIDVLKIDKGICRHIGNFTPPANEDVDNDEYTVLLLKMNPPRLYQNIGDIWKATTLKLQIGNSWKDVTSLKTAIGEKIFLFDRKDEDLFDHKDEYLNSAIRSWKRII